MSHPFMKMFERSLKTATQNNNTVLKEAIKLHSKGYRSSEIASVLEKLKLGLIDDNESQRVQEALDAFNETL